MEEGRNLPGSSWGGWVARREHRAATAAACLVALTLCVGVHVARPRGDVILGELHSAARQGKGSSAAPEVRGRGGGASSATAETAAAAMKPVLQQQQQQERVSVSALASKVLLEQAQEAAAAGERWVEVASQEHKSILGSMKEHDSALDARRQMDTLAAQDEAEGEKARQEAEKAATAAAAAEATMNLRLKEAQSANAEALSDDTLSAEADARAKELEADSVAAAREAEEQKAAAERTDDDIQKTLFDINNLKRKLIVTKDWEPGVESGTAEEAPKAPGGDFASQVGQFFNFNGLGLSAGQTPLQRLGLHV